MFRKKKIYNGSSRRIKKREIKGFLIKFILNLLNFTKKKLSMLLIGSNDDEQSLSKIEN